ncbi:hypothetical protein NI17_020580 [Thermobifida halotolerans]|uniref:Uncharacterized protein n=1 Tax=Thermobifida halotolerans TaxID=483545 RepID=A0A399G005_9ACTN|nr:hypothetical protein [Thermobifida halotolerans]UOE19125.1 hypothetical protein NI17_020580 [Thermobifida halotolerans]
MGNVLRTGFVRAGLICAFLAFAGVRGGMWADSFRQGETAWECTTDAEHGIQDRYQKRTAYDAPTGYGLLSVAFMIGAVAVRPSPRVPVPLPPTPPAAPPWLPSGSSRSTADRRRPRHAD